MTRYTGNHCPVCEQAFTDEDDIVVCPDCGTPYHRACWQKIGACMHKTEPANPLKAEYLLPIYIDELLHAGKVSVKVLPTHDKWFGVTYAEDKQTVIDSFAKLVADGVYQKDLFSDLKK